MGIMIIRNRLGVIIRLLFKHTIQLELVNIEVNLLWQAALQELELTLGHFAAVIGHRHVLNTIERVVLSHRLYDVIKSRRSRMQDVVEFLQIVVRRKRV